MRAHEAQGYGKHLDNVVQSNLGFGAGIGCQPQENPVHAAHTELETAERHWEACLATGRIESELVGDIVVVVTKVPQSEIRDQTKIDAAALAFRGSSASRSVCGDALLQCLWVYKDTSQ